MKRLHDARATGDLMWTYLSSLQLLDPIQYWNVRWASLAPQDVTNFVMERTDHRVNTALHNYSIVIRDAVT